MEKCTKSEIISIQVKSMYRQEELGKIRAIGYGIAFVVIIVVTLLRLIPR